MHTTVQVITTPTLMMAVVMMKMRRVMMMMKLTKRMMMMLIIRVITIWPPHHGDSLEETWSVNVIQPGLSRQSATIHYHQVL